MLICRTCLARKNLTPLFSERGTVEFDVNQLFKATGLEMQKNDGFPQLACNSCIKQIRQFIHFQELCTKAHDILRSIIPAIKTETIHVKSIYDDVIYGNDNPLFKDAEISNIEQNISNSNSDIIVKVEIEPVDDDDIPISNLREEISNVETPEEPKSKHRNNSKRKIQKSTQKRITIEDLESSDSGSDRGLEYDVEMPELTASWTTGATTDVTTLSSLFTMNQNGFERQKTLNEFKERNEFYMSLAVNPHNKAIHRKSPIECNKCHKVLSDKASFLTHARTHFEPEFSCDICNKKFHSRYHMGYHQQRRHGRVKRLACTQCGFRAVDRTTLLNHVRLEHTGERPYVCDECGVSFRMRRAIAQHMRTHFGVKNHQCDRCPGMYKSLSQLWSHQHRVHLMTYTYPCYLCSDTYRSREAVKKHLLNVHGLPNDQQLKVECVKIKK